MNASTDLLCRKREERCPEIAHRKAASQALLWLEKLLCSVQSPDTSSLFYIIPSTQQFCGRIHSHNIHTVFFSTLYMMMMTLQISRCGQSLWFYTINISFRIGQGLIVVNLDWQVSFLTINSTNKYTCFYTRNIVIPIITKILCVWNSKQSQFVVFPLKFYNIYYMTTIAVFTNI